MKRSKKWQLNNLIISIDRLYLRSALHRVAQALLLKGIRKASKWKIPSQPTTFLLNYSRQIYLKITVIIIITTFLHLQRGLLQVQRLCQLQVPQPKNLKWTLFAMNTKTYPMTDTDFCKDIVRKKAERLWTKIIFYFRYETSDGQTREEVGYFRDDEKLGRLLNVRGSYTYTGDDGKLVIVRYVADENGYRQSEGPAHPEALPPKVISSLLGWNGKVKRQ